MENVKENASFELMPKDEICDMFIRAFDCVGYSFGSTFAEAVKICSKLEQYKIQKNTKAFLDGFRSGDLNEEGLAEYRKLLEDKAFCEQEVIRIISLLSKDIDQFRTEIFGCLFLNMVNGRITYDEFIDYCDVTNKMYISDFKYLVGDYQGIEDNLARLSGIGISKYRLSATVDEQDGILRTGDSYPLTAFGAKYKDLISHVVRRIHGDRHQY